MDTISIRNLVLSRKNKENTVEDRIVLKGIDADFKSGQLNAVMGPNGSGKTTFLSILFGKIDADMKTYGQILYNNKERTTQEWFDDVSYVEQESVEYKDQSVLSLIQFAAEMKRLRTGKKLTHEKLDEILTALHLKHLLEKNVNEISGGERKRTMIAIELVMMKKVFILDEPTSDLDSHLALQLINYLKQVAEENNTTIIFTIHQPSDQVFKKFDNVLMIVDGCQIYSGSREKLLASQNLEKPVDWTISDFLFEAFYKKTEFDGSSVSKEAINKMMKNAVTRSENIVSDAVLTKKGHKSVFDLRFSFGHFKVLYLRAFSMIFSQKKTYINFMILAVIFGGILYLSKLGFVNLKAKSILPLYLIDSRISASFDSDVTIDQLFSNRSNYDKTPADSFIIDMLKVQISNSLFALCMLLASLCFFFDSSILKMKAQFINEISKAFYSAFTLFAVVSVVEFILFTFSATILITAASFLGYLNFLSFADFASVFLVSTVFSQMNAFFNIILIHPTIKSSFIKNVLYICKCLGVYLDFYSITMMVASMVPVLKSPLMIAFSTIIVTILPSHFYLFVIKNNKIQEDKAKFLNSHSNILSTLDNFNPMLLFEEALKHNFKNIFNDSGDFSNSWMYAGLFISTVCMLSLSIFVFTRIFSPRIKIKI